MLYSFEDIFLKFLSGDNIGQQNELTHSVLYCNYIAISHYFMWVPLQVRPPVPKIAWCIHPASSTKKTRLRLWEKCTDFGYTLNCIHFRVRRTEGSSTDCNQRTIRQTIF